jgi:hypothetical protein
MHFLFYCPEEIAVAQQALGSISFPVFFIDFTSKCYPMIPEEQAKLLEKYITQSDLWVAVADVPGEDSFLTRGEKTRVYLDKDEKISRSSAASSADFAGFTIKPVAPRSRALFSISRWVVVEYI